MALALRGHHQGITLRELIAIGRELGISPSDVREAVHRVGGNFMEASIHLGANVYDAVNDLLRQHRERIYNEHQDNLERDHARIMAESHPRDPRAPQFNLPPTQEMTKRHHGGDPIAANHGSEGHNMGRAPEEGGEQQVTKPHHIWRRFPNTQTAALKWVMTLFAAGVTDYTGYKIPYDRQDYTTATSLSTTGGGAWGVTAKNELAGASLFANATELWTPQLFQLRMTTPYNILKNAFNNGVAASNHAEPTWLSYFDQMYQYYHTLETEWELNFHFGVPISADNTAVANYQHLGIYIFWKYTEQDDPPVSWSNKVGAVLGDARSTAYTENAAPTPDQSTTIALTDAGTVLPCNADDYFRMGGWNHKYVSFDTITQVKTKIKGLYKYGQCKMDIKTIQASDTHGGDTTAEGWSLTNSTPAFPELLSVIVCWDNATYNTNAIKVPMSVRFETEQLVQFKDLKANYKFPTPELNNPLDTSGISFTTEYNFMRGAVNT